MTELTEADRRSSSARAANAPIPGRRKSDGPMLPMPEVVLLLDSAGRILRSSEKFSGERLSKFSFEPGLLPHEALHPGCDGSECDFAADWSAAWSGHASGLPVEWLLTQPAMDSLFRLRLQSVTYACGVLFGDAIDDYERCSVLFVQDVSGDSLGRAARQDTSDIRIERATLYQLRRATDDDADLVASLDERLRSATRRLLASQEEERKRIASELHDGLGQTLSLLRFEIEDCLERVERPESCNMRETLERACNHAQRALQELRGIAKDLRPTVMNELGLPGSLEALCSDFRRMSPDIDLRLRLPANLASVPDELAVTLYRIAQEGLNNICRHSNASKASFTVSTDSEGIELVIRDNGIGFAADGVSRNGLGLITMRERAETIGGAYSMQSAPDEGCTVTARWDTSKLRLLR